MQNRKKDRDGIHQRSDSPFYWASFTDASGKRVRRSTGTKNLKEAQAILAGWKHTVHLEEKWGLEPTRYFDELMLRYLTETKSKKSHATDKQITRTLREFFGGVILNNLAAEDINSYIQERRKLVSDSTINRELGLFSAALNHARIHWGWNLTNHVQGRRPRPAAGRVRWITQEEAQRLIDLVAKNPRRAHLRDFIEIGLNTGMRSQEILGLSWSRVDLKQRLVYLTPENNKSGRNRSVPLNEQAFDAVIRRAQFRAKFCPGSEWVFAKKDGQRIASVKKGFKAACIDAGIDNFTPHDLRHTCAAWLIQSGVSLSQIKELLGHTSVQVTEKYAHISPENVRQAVAGLNKASHDLVTLGKK